MLDKCQGSSVQVSEKYSREARTDVNDGEGSSGVLHQANGALLSLSLTLTILYYWFGES